MLKHETPTIAQLTLRAKYAFLLTTPEANFRYTMSQTLNPNSSRGSMQRSHRTRSPAGTRRKPHGTEASTGGAVLFVQGPDHHTAEEHELEEVSISEDRHSHDALGIETTGQPRSFRSHVHQRASYATDSETDSQIVERRYRDPEFSQPRTDTSDSEDRAQQNRPESLWSQNDTHVPRRNLSTFDVAALIFNKMVLLKHVNCGFSSQLAGWQRHLHNSRCRSHAHRIETTVSGFMGHWRGVYTPVVGTCCNLRLGRI